MANKQIKKLLLSFIFAIFLMLCFSVKTNALCTTKSYSDLKMIAFKSEVSYELNFDKNHNYYFLLHLDNVDDNIVVKFEGYKYKPKDGSVDVSSKIYGGKTYEVYLYGANGTACPDEYLYTKRITVPKYNVYSERDECIEYEEFYLCNKWYAGNITNDEDFLNQLDVYIKSLERKEPEKKQVEEKSLVQKIIEFYMNNKIITIPITIIILLFIAYRIVVRIIRRRNRIKLSDR